MLLSLNLLLRRSRCHRLQCWRWLLGMSCRMMMPVERMLVLSFLILTLLLLDLLSRLVAARRWMWPPPWKWHLSVLLQAQRAATG